MVFLGIMRVELDDSLDARFIVPKERFEVTILPRRPDR